jgi:hypothetical protein
VTVILWFETRRFTTLLATGIATIDLILKEARRASDRHSDREGRLEGEVVHSAVWLYVAACGIKRGER